MSLVVLNKMSRKTPSQGSNSNVPEWKKLALSDPTLGDKEVEILLHGPKSLSQAWMLQALKVKYFRGGS